MACRPSRLSRWSRDRWKQKKEAQPGGLPTDDASPTGGLFSCRRTPANSRRITGSRTTPADQAAQSL